MEEMLIVVTEEMKTILPVAKGDEVGEVKVFGLVRKVDEGLLAAEQVPSVVWVLFAYGEEGVLNLQNSRELLGVRCPPDHRLDPLFLGHGVLPRLGDEAHALDLVKPIHVVRVTALIQVVVHHAQSRQINDVLNVVEPEVAARDDLVLGLQVDDPAVLGVRGRAVRGLEEDLLFEDELEIPALPSLLDDNVSEEVRGAKGARRPRQVFDHGIFRLPLDARVDDLSWHVVHEETHVLDQLVLHFQEVRTDLSDLADGEVGGDGKVRAEDLAVN
mmetsp:Transcript_13909/g.27727  ORF Transcript_13909/g.27727 Transcript_13909/m.27727 type:complete len:272 (+) Transcript_13909:210-1025(+)